MIEISELINYITTYYKSILAVLGSVLICLTTTSCACGGGGCSIGGTETHQLMNERLAQSKIVEARSWKK